MDLSALSTYLKSKGQPLTMSAGDANLPQRFQNFIATMPNKQVTLSPGDGGINLQGSTLTVLGTTSDVWPVQGMQNVSVTLSSITITIDDGAAAPAIHGTARGSLPITASFNTPVTVTALPQDHSPWQIKLAQDAAGITARALLLLGKEWPLPFDIPTNLDLLDRALTVNQDGFQITFFPNTVYEVQYSLQLSAPQAQWTLIDNILSLNGIDLNAFMLTNSMSAVLVGHILIGGVGLDVGVGLNIGENWMAFVKPTREEAFPGLAALASWVGGAALSSDVSSGFGNLNFDTVAFDAAIEAISVGFNSKTRKLNYLDIISLLTVGALRLDVVLRLPDLTIIGRLHDGPVKVKDMLSSLGLPADTVPDNLNITSVTFEAQPRNSYYSAGMSIDSAWQVGPVKLEEVSVSIYIADPGGLTGQFECQLAISEKIMVYLVAEYAGANGGWQFEGSTGPEQEIPIGDLIADLASKFGNVVVPSAIADLTIQDLAVSFNTKTKNFFFTGDAKFALDDKQVDIQVTIDIQNEGASFSKRFGGTITIGTLKFDLNFHQNKESNVFVATYHHTASQSLSIKDFVALASSTLAEPVPANLTIDLKDVIFAYSKGATESKFLFGLDIGTGINLSNSPLVGQELPANQTVGVDNLQLVVAFKGLTRSEVTAFNDLFPGGVTKLPEPDEGAVEGDGGGTGNSETQIVIERGLTVSAIMNFGDSTRALSLPVAAPIQTGGTMPPPANVNTSTVDSALWFSLQKSFGPVYFEKVGVQYKDAAIWFLLTGSLSAAGLTLALDGFAVGSRLNEFKPQFSLRGLGIDYKNGPLEIGGTFLRREVGTGPQAYDEYDGVAIIKTPQLTLKALGSYARLDGYPSMFIYAVLDSPIGGPAFFFVTGLSAGFGYNRSLIIPSLDQLTEFPLIAEAITPPDPQPTLETELQSLQRYIPPAMGEYFLAVGIKFTSFKMIDSFALLTVSFGRRFEVDLLGTSTLIAPTPEAGSVITPLAVVQMAIRARFVPDEGFLGIAGQLTAASYILSRDCHLTGGFAFYGWFSGDQAGDFVQTLGGYHPQYHPPAHYPIVPRVGFNWRVNGNLSLKGEAYYALTASALMAGGRLQGTWESDNLKAWFDAAADFLVSWKPYHYDAAVSVNVQVAYTYRFFGTHHLNADVGADLHLWGPEFSGKARIRLSIISFEISFGDNASARPKAIDWQTFKGSFLPPDASVCGISVKSGLVNAQNAGEADYWVVNPKEFCFVVNSVIPVKEAYKGTAQITVAGASTSFGIGSMEVGAANLATRQTITITRKGSPAEADFTFTPVLKNVPMGMWGTSLTPSLNGQEFVPGTLAGFEVRPAGRPPASETADIARADLELTEQAISRAYEWQDISSFNASTQTDEQRRQAIKDSIASSNTATARSQILQAIGITDEVDVVATLADAFLVAPQIGALAGR